jgi:hypothetical protein
MKTHLFKITFESQVKLVGTRDLQTLWSPPISLNQERHTQRRKTTIYLFIYIYCFWWKFVEKSPMKTYMEGMSDIYKSPILV